MSFQEKQLIAVKASWDKPGVFPDPIIITPKEHHQTFIILHGRGSTAEKFGPPLLEMATTSGEKLQSAFPNAKIIFLTASRNKATIYKKSLTHQWFDHWHMEEPNKRQDLMHTGLHKSCNYVQEILRQEIHLVGKENVVLWGLSQGCATSLTTLLSWNDEPFAAIVGMCGYLPYANHIEEIAGKKELGYGYDGDDNDDDPFGKEDGDEYPFSLSGDEDEDEKGGIFERQSSTKQDPATEAVQFLRGEIDMEDKTGMIFREIPVFLGHGTEDEKVPIEIGREARRCLDLVGADVQMMEYEGLGHWYSGQMLNDIFDFLREKLHIKD